MTFFFIAIGVFGFVITRFYHEFLSFLYDSSYFLISHTILELFSIFVSISIFFHGWLTFPHTKSFQRLWLSLTFLSVGVIDLVHTLSYKGMPFFQSEYTVAIATWFWIIARFTESVGLAYILSLKSDFPITVQKKNWMTAVSLVYMVSIIFIVLTFAGQLPVLIDANGVTSFKMTLEYIISAIHLYTFWMIIRQYFQNKNADHLTVSAGLLFILIAELVFTLYKDVYDIDNLLGHVYKALGYFFLLRGIFFPQFEQVFTEKEQVHTQWQKARQRLEEQEKKMSTLTIQAQEEERKRVSRDLHDGVGQSLYSMLVSLKMIQKAVRDDNVREELHNLQQLASQSLEDVRKIAFQLRPSILDDLGLIPAIRSHIERYEKTFNIRVEFHVQGLKERLEPEIETALFRICQEALNNAAKYSKTPVVYVTIIKADDALQMEIRDEGKGFDIGRYEVSDRKSLGLYGMKERTELVNGTFTIDSRPGEGTSIEVYIPLNNI